MPENNSLQKNYLLRESQRRTKRFIAFLIPLVFIVLIVAVKIISSQPAPTCFDGLKNGAEEDVDCGGACVVECVIKYADPIKIISTEVLEGEKNFSQIAIKIINNNQDLGAEFSYQGIIKGDLGQKIGEFSGKDFIYPATTKYLIEPKINSPIRDIKKVEVEISTKEWFHSQFRSADLLVASEARASRINDAAKPGYLEVKGRISNQTARDFPMIDLVVLLYSKTGQLLAVAKTQVLNLKATTIKDFYYSWLNYFPAIEQVNLNRIEVYADVLVK